jgi:uracil-DNA glycosylase
MFADVKIHESWKQALQPEFEKPYFQELIQFVKSEYKTHVVYPAGRDIFRAFDLCPLPQTRVVIIGQDPYHGPGQAHGLCFSVPDGTPFPPSLQNIFKELQNDVGKAAPPSGNLMRWARQGVLLLNATLTVRAGQAGSHQNKGWEVFTDAVIRVVAEQPRRVVFMLWGAYAQKKGAVIDAGRHLVLRCAHPSPLSAHQGFFGSRHFSQANAYLREHGGVEIEW